jgi:hypothetical protein
MPAPSTYVGATARSSPADGLRLPDRLWAWQPKIDGCYVEAHTDTTGRLSRLVSRAGLDMPLGDLAGIVAAPPCSVLVGELEASTEAGVAAAASRRYRLVHLFDALTVAGADLRGLSYLERWGWLHRAQSLVESDGSARVETWRDDVHGRPHAVDGSGLFARRVPRDLRRFPTVPLTRGHAAADELWRSHVEVGGGEGLVAVRLDAPARARGPAAKRKIKLTDTIDARVVATSPGVARVAWRGGTSAAGWQSRPEPFVVPSPRPLPIGTVVEVAHDGWYSSGVPRFARVVRRRGDLA